MTVAVPLKILILEDNQSDADLLCRTLVKSGMEFTSQVVQTRKDYEQALESFNPDLILSDYSLPAFDAVTAFEIKQQNHSMIPFIIVSGVIGEENAISLIKSGVTDYVSKEKLFTLPTQITRAISDTEAKREKLIIAEQLKTLNLELLALNEELEMRVATRTTALRESESRFRSMMETIPQIAWTNTIAGKVEYFNQRWYNYIGSGSIATNLQEFKTAIHPDDLVVGLAGFSSIMKAEDGGEFQIRLKRADDIYRWHLIRLMPIKDDQNSIQLWVGTATDIEELRVLQQYKDDFISIASHEIKTPITSLKGSLQMLDRIKADPPSPMSYKLLAQASKSLSKVNVLIEDLLNASMANQGQLNINSEIFNLFQLIEGCVGGFELEHHEISVEGNSETMIFADPIRIEQILVNFITNATKYAPDGKQIIIRIEQNEITTKVSVIDHGPGIAEEKIRYLFDRYYRTENNGSRYTGLGLGLYICAEIIKKHEGQIGADSIVGSGTTFWFTLPSH